MSSAQASNTVMGPAIFLIVVASLGALVALFNILTGIGMSNPDWILELMKDAPPEAREQLRRSFGSGVMSIVTGVVWLAISGFIIAGAIQMMKLRAFGVAMAASIIAMIPCLGTPSCCCVLGIPAGIWALVVLMKPEIKASFT